MFQRFIYAVLGCALCVAHAMAENVVDPEPTAGAFELTGTWWEGFGDSTLDSLIDMGLANNYNLQMAMKRSEIARNAVAQARAGWFPTVVANAGYTRSQQSGRMTSERLPQSAVSYFSAGLSAQWEIDIFGKIASGVKAKKNAYNASKAEYDGAMVALTAQIAATYIELRQYQAALDVARQHAEGQMKIVNIAKARYETTLASKLDVAQAMETYYSTVAQVPVLEYKVSSAVNALSVLVGQDPGAVKGWLSQPAPLPSYRILVASELPADWLRNRPDVREAESNLEMYAAEIGIAKKDFLPTLTITGSVGTAAHNIGDMFAGGTLTYSVVPTLSWTLFDGLSRKYELANARETMQIGIDNYNLTMLTATQEVENALGAYHSSLKYADAMQQVIIQNNEALDLSVQRYKNSLSPMSDVVTAQINALNAENTYISAEASALQALISLYEAFGGGMTAD